MDWQQRVALAIVAATALLMIWGRLRGRRKACGEGGCGCAGSTLLGATQIARVGPRLIVTSRKGERPRIRERAS